MTNKQISKKLKQIQKLIIKLYDKLDEDYEGIDSIVQNNLGIVEDIINNLLNDLEV